MSHITWLCCWWLPAARQPPALQAACHQPLLVLSRFVSVFHQHLSVTVNSQCLLHIPALQHMLQLCMPLPSVNTFTTLPAGGVVCRWCGGPPLKLWLCSTGVLQPGQRLVNWWHHRGVQVHPPGNVVGQFAQNVLAPSGSGTPPPTPPPTPHQHQRHHHQVAEVVAAPAPRQLPGTPFLLGT